MSRLTPFQQRLLDTLADCAKRGQCMPTQAELAGRFGVARETISSAMTRLRLAGKIKLWNFNGIRGCTVVGVGATAAHDAPHYEIVTEETRRKALAAATGHDWRDVHLHSSRAVGFE